MISVRTGSLIRWWLIGTLGVLAFAPGLVAAQADELPGWYVGPAAWSFNKFTFFEAVDKTAALGLHHIEAFENQRLAPGIEAKVGADLSDALVTKIREKLDRAHVTLTSLYIHMLPREEPAARKDFELCRKLGVATIISEPAPESISMIERLCDEFRINVAIHNHPNGSSRYWHPREVLKVVEGRSPRLGACADIGHWQRSGIRPVDGLRMLGSRIITMHVKDLDQLAPDGHDVPWGTGRGEIGEVLREVRRLGVTPTLFAIEYEYDWDNNGPAIARCAEFFKKTVSEIAAAEAAREHPLAVGWATVDITPQRPVALVGQLHKRISTGVRDPLTATVLALETRGENGAKEQAVMVSCDLISSPREIQERLRKQVAAGLPDLDVSKLFLNATHTHTAPGLLESKFKGLYDVSNDKGVMKASEYADFFLDRVAAAVASAWKGRKPGGLSWGLGHAVVGHNRRARYFDGTTKMYGDTTTPAFANVEGHVDHDVDLLFFWDGEGPGRLSGLVINLPCTAQEVEQLYEVSADFWHDVRELLHARLGNEVFIFPQCAPAGDLSPHPIFRTQAQHVMDARLGLSRRKAIATRIARSVEEVLPVARAGLKENLVFRHTVVKVDLPEHKPASAPFYVTDSVHPAELHVLRLGDVALATSPFELYVDYADRIEARSHAVTTMLIQLSSGDSGYLPTQRGVEGGGYSADRFVVGPQGGQVLVDETVKQINALWP